jgi:trans-aconitate methyltransferase
VGLRMTAPATTGARPGTTSTAVPQWEPRWEPLPEAYLLLSQDYRRRTELFAGWRELLVGRLGLRRGDTVIDVGCGTGLNFAALHAAVGPGGRIIGIDESPQLLAVAARHVARRRWHNVDLINASAERAELPAADAALFCAGHELLQSPTALAHILHHLRPGAAVAAGGWKWPSKWLWPLRACVTALAGPFVAEFTGFDQPWRLLADHLTHLRVSELGLGTGYLAHGYTAGHTSTCDTPTTKG